LKKEQVYRGKQMNMQQLVGSVSLLLAFATQAQIQTAGNLLIDVNASALSGLANNATVSAWTNSGTLSGNFVPAVSGQGAIYQTSVGGIPAVTFAGSANSVMTNTVPPPSSILSNNIWSAEIWVLNPSLQTIEDQFAWTDRSGWSTAGDGQCMEIRYCADTANAVEHYNSNCNIPWTGALPLAGAWHHIAITRSSDGSERLYADGVLRTTKTPAVSNLRSGAPFAMGGVWDRTALSWQYPFSGSLAQVRVHSGTLTGAQVLNNFLAERDNYHAIWSGATGTALPWADGASWVSNNVAESGSTAWITNGGIAVLSSSLSLNHIYPDFGGLSVTNGATLTLGAQDNVNMGNNGSSFALTVADGAFRIPGTNTVNFYMGNGGGDVTASIGGTGAAALLDVDRDTIVANSSGSVGSMTMGVGGGVYNSNGWFYLANNIGAQAQMTVNGGTVGFRTADKDFVVNVNGARGDVTVNSGLISATGNFKWSASLSTNTAYGRVQLNGGTIEAKKFFGETTGGTNLLYLNGGTVKARVTTTDFLYNLTGAYVQNSGVAFDIPANVTVTAAQALLADTGSTGGLTKLGAGRITFAGTNTFTGNINVLAGDLFFGATNGLASGYAGTITLTNDASSAIGYAKPDAAAQILARMNTNSVGYLTLFAANAADTVDFTSFPYLKLAFVSVTNFTGTFIPYGGIYSFKTEGSIVTNAMVMTDGSSAPGHLKIVGTSAGGMVLNSANTFTGGTEIDGANVTMANAGALGTQATPGVPDVALRNGAVLRLVAAMNVNAFVTNRLTATSNGILLLGASNATQNVDLTGRPGIVLGSAEYTLDYGGTITPDGTTYRLGGGNATYAATPYRGLSLSNLTDNGSASAVVIGTPGIVELKTGNTYSGGTVVTNRGVLFLASDSLGAVPASSDPANLYVNNGVIRCGNSNFSLNVNRGVTVGAGGMELHPWGPTNWSMTVLGNLAGVGGITTTDTGLISFGGANNTFSGSLTVGGGCNVRIGNGANFSWGSSLSITNSGTLYLKTDTAKSFSNTVLGSGAVRKEGTGDLTLSGSQIYNGVTYVDAGALKVAATNVLPRGSGKGVVEIAAGARLDSNGGDLLVGGLQGVGSVTNGTATASSLYVGETNVNATFGGTVNASLALVKIGAGTQTLTNTFGAANNAEVRAGTLELLGSAAVTGTVTLAGGTLGVTYGTTGLIGKYYQLSAAPLTSDFVSYAAVTNFLNGKTPAVVSNSIGFGTTFNALANGSRFPSLFGTQTTSNFAALWSGLFFAPTTGVYGFATASDDGSMVFIDGQTALDNNAMQGYTLTDTNVVGNVTLQAGMHQIDIAFYEGGGDQGLTVWVKLPGAPALTELPHSLLFTGLDAGSARVGTLAGNAGSVSFANMGQATLRVTGDSDMTYGGAILGSNQLSRLVKQGSGTLSLSSGKSDHFGSLEVQSGKVALTNGPATLGTLKMSAGAATTVSGSKGLSFYFYNRSTSDASYTVFQSMTAWEAYLSSAFPSGPSYVTNSLMLGANIDTGSAGTAWPVPYVQGVGAEQETFDAYLFGSIYLSQSGVYTFGTASDDGSMLYIDRTLVVNNGKDQGMGTPLTGTITLTAGFHRIDILYRENTGGNALQAYIGYPGQTLTLMPQSILFGGSVIRGLAGDAGSTLSLGASAALLLNQDADTVQAGTITGDASATIQKNNGGMLTLTDDNAGYFGSYSVTGGTLRVGNGGATGALGPTASANVGPAGRLVFNRAGTVTVGGSLSGTGLIVLDGPGDVYVTSTNAFVGTVQINSGRLIFAPGATLGSAASITNAVGVKVETTGSRLQSAIMGNLSGSGDLWVTGSGTLLLNNSNTNFTGVTRVTTGATVRVARPLNLGDRSSVALDGGTLSVLPDVTQGSNALASALSTNTWRINGNASWVTRYTTQQWLQLTPNTASQAGSAFYTNKLDCSAPWYAAFRYEVGDHPAAAADGMTFILQNDPRGLAALGASGGGLGACKDGANGTPISPSIGIFFNIYQTPAVGWITNGVRVDAVTALNGINPTNGVDVTLSYDGTALKLTLTQAEKTYTAMRTVNLPSVFASNTVYVGFSGGTGGATAQQFVGNFSMFDALSASTDFINNSLTVASGGTGILAASAVNDNLLFRFAGFGLGSGATLSVVAGEGSKGNTDYTVAASNLTVSAGIGTVNVAANGTGKGVLALTKLTLGSGAKLVLTGAVSAPSGVLTVVVPTPVQRGITYLADFRNATWIGAKPTIALVDASGNPINETVSLRNGLLYINTVKGTLIQIK